MTATLTPSAAPADSPPPLPTLGPHAHGERFAWDDYLAALDADDVTPGCFSNSDAGS